MQMAEALARGFIASKQATPEQMFCVDISAERKDVFKVQLLCFFEICHHSSRTAHLVPVHA